MYNKEQVFLYMKDEIETLANEEEAKILKEAKKLETDAKLEVEAEAKQDAKIQLEKELAELSSKASLDLSNENVEKTKQLVEKRNEYVANIFEDAKQKLLAFVDGSQYQEYLLNKLSKMNTLYSFEKATLYVKQKDLGLKDMLVKTYGKPIDVEVSNQIVIGGFLLEDKVLNIVVNETLDFALENQKDWFYQHSGFMIK